MATFADTTALAQRPPADLALVSLPSESTLSRLVWTTLVTLDNANRTGRYDVLYQLGSPGFQRRNPVETLSTTFAPLREGRVDVGRVLLQTPRYYTPPAILPDGTLRLRGGFGERPRTIRFDLVYRRIEGGWRIDALSVVDIEADAPR